MNTPKAAKDWVKGKTINIRVKKHQREMIDRAAETMGKNRSDFMLECACREAESVLLDQKIFVLEEDAFRQFRDQIAASSKPNAKLKALLETKPAWEK